MQKQAGLLLFILSVCVFLSCLTKKNKGVTVKQVHVVAVDTLQIIPQDMINLQEYSQAYSKLNTQRFTAGHKNISTITADKGLKITIDPGVLEDEEGRAPAGKIDIAVIELTNTEELFKANAATVCDGRLLSSGGSYFIGMESKGKKLRIKKGQQLSISFPVLSKNEMELFYGERDASENMNWKRANVMLDNAGEMIGFTDSDRYITPSFLPGLISEEGKAIMHRSLQTKVYYMDKMMTLEQLVDTINHHEKRVVIDTVRGWPAFEELRPGQRRDTNWIIANYGPEKQFILRTYRDIEKEKQRKALAEQRRKELIAQWQPQDLGGQLQKYYNPTGISRLGWLNCDRFYRSPLDAEIEMDLPITFRSATIQYFLLYPSINGLMNGTLAANEEGSFVLKGQPAGEKLLLIAFVKKEGKIFHTKKELVIRKKSPVKMDFAEISPEMMNKMFGRNVRI